MAFEEQAIWSSEEILLCGHRISSRSRNTDARKSFGNSHSSPGRSSQTTSRGTQGDPEMTPVG